MTILNFNLIQRQPWDVAGISTSTLCVLHCLATPLLVVFLPVLEVVEKQTHAAFALAILALGLLAFWPGYQRHGRWQIIITAIVGFGLISLGVTAPEGMLSESAEVAATVLGGGTLVIAHLYNAFFCRNCRHCGGQDCMID
ncbi:MAG: MerC domain-containing protein [Candidatus Thiodiazotropha sp. (ex Monitilora ramsayi)]|nr:MerC domain-containing protein [Candidatus Thiodiazotropha sp. (ex Monitilora ramsayi)]